MNEHNFFRHFCLFVSKDGKYDSLFYLPIFLIYDQVILLFHQVGCLWFIFVWPNKLFNFAVYISSIISTSIVFSQCFSIKIRTNVINVNLILDRENSGIKNFPLLYILPSSSSLVNNDIFDEMIPYFQELQAHTHMLILGHPSKITFNKSLFFTNLI